MAGWREGYFLTECATEWRRDALEPVDSVLVLTGGGILGPIGVARCEGACCRGGWAVTHLPTGLAMGYCLPDVETARDLAEALFGLTDWWGVGREGVTGIPALAEAVRVTLARFGRGPSRAVWV